MLRLFALIAQTTLLGLVAYNSVTALWGWRDREPAGKGPRTRSVLVLVPAHDEETVIAGAISDVLRSDYPPHLVELWVIADRCTDSTAEVARALGAGVAERTEGEGGKGSALSWFLERHPTGAGTMIAVFDADNRIPPDALGRMVDECDSGESAVQCYLDALDPSGSLVAEASAMSYWAGNRMVQLARTNLGWTADLGGTGMGLTVATLERAGGFSDSLTEDQDLGVRLLLAGHRVTWLHDVRIADEKPRELGVAVRQRARWMAGKRNTRRRHLRSLLSRPTPANVDMAIRLIQPGRSFLALVSAVVAAVAWMAQPDWLLDRRLWLAATVVQVAQPIPYLLRDGLGARQVARYPLLALIAALWIPVRLMSTLTSGWFHTPHQGVSPDRGEGPAP